MDLAKKLRTYKPSTRPGTTGGSRTKQDLSREVLKIDPYEAKFIKVREQMKKDVSYRISVLRKVKTLQVLGNEELTQACESMSTRTYRDGEDIIRQGEKGDSLYLLQSGEVVVTRKHNPKDASEKPTVLATLPRNTCFGEIALLTEEPRSATITAVGTCVAVSMKKKHFDEILEKSNEKHKKMMTTMCMNVIETVPLFKDLSRRDKSQIITLMTPVSYPAGSYICRQGGLGNSFFVIIDGLVRCTVNDENSEGDEKELVRLGPGSFFGEQALLDPSSIRSANIISTEATNCLSLSRDHFTSIIREIKQAEIQANQEVYNRPGMNRNKKGKVRRITGMSQKTLARTEDMQSIVPRMAKFLSESLWSSMYSKMYRDVTIFPSKMEEYGEVLWDVMRTGPTRAEAIRGIRRKFQEISEVKSNLRTIHQNSFLCGLMRLPNKLKSQMCANWHPFQYTELCKSCTFKTMKPLETIVDVGSHGTTMFLILRGAVRRWKGTLRTNLMHDEDLISGDIFGEMAMEGQHTRKICVRAMTEVDVAIIEEKVFFDIQHKGEPKLTTGEKFAFLRGLKLFKHTDDTVLQQVAHAVTQVVLSRNTILTKPGITSQDVYFIMKGSAEVVAPLNKHGTDEEVISNHFAVAKIHPGEILGESGFINNKNTGGAKQKERHWILADQRIDVLVLSPNYFFLFDKNIVNAIVSGFKSKHVFRDQRLSELLKERIASWTVKRSMKSIPDASSEEKERNDSTVEVSIHLASNNPEMQHQTTGGVDRGSQGSVGVIGTGTDLRSMQSQPSSAETKSSTDVNTITALARLCEETKAAALEDIPLTMNGHFDPFMVLDACYDDRDQKAKQFMLRNIKRPRSVRSRGREVAKLAEPGYVTLQMEKSGANSVRPGSGCVGSDVALARYLSQKAINTDGTRVSIPQRRPGTAGGRLAHTLSDEISVLSISTGLPPVATKIPGSKSVVSTLTDGELGIPTNRDKRPSSSHAGQYLQGSLNFPAQMPYVDSLQPSHRTDTSPARSRSGSPVARSASRPTTAGF